MPRSARVVVAGSPHHVCLRGSDHRRLFSSPADYARFVTCLALGLDAGGCTLQQVTLMPDQVRLVATPSSATGLATLVHRAGQRYTQVRNAQQQACGSLFEARYHSRPIVDDRDLMAVTIGNDVSWYRAGRGVGPLTHAWSTGPLHAGARGSRIPRSLWTPSAWYLALGTTPAQRAERYAQLVAGYLRASGPALVEGDTKRAPGRRLRLGRADRLVARATT